MGIITFIWDIINALPLIIAVASALSAVTPTTADDTFVQKYLVRFVDLLALNIGSATPQKK